MRIKFYQSTACKADQAMNGFTEMLQQSLVTQDGMLAVDNHEDMIHLLGPIDDTMIRIITTAYQRHIPLIYSPLGALSPWLAGEKGKLLTRAVQKAVSLVPVVHAIGPYEQSVIERLMDKECLVLSFPNPVVTNQVSKDEMAEFFASNYKKYAARHDGNIRRAIDMQLQELKDDITLHLCKEILYLHYWHIRETLPLHAMNALTDYMTSHDYDEEAFALTLKRLRMDVFFGRLEQVMADCCSLTEGYMPLPAIADKQTEKMAAMVFNPDNLPV